MPDRQDFRAVNRSQRIALIVAAIAVAVVTFVVAGSGSDDDPAPAPPGGNLEGSSRDSRGPTGQTTAAEATSGTTGTVPTRPAEARVTVRGGKPVGGVQRIEVEKGDTVRIAVRSDVAEEVHLHGYDISRDVAAGGTARFRFTARIEGIFEIELEGSHEQIAQLVVEP